MRRPDIGRAVQQPCGFFSTHLFFLLSFLFLFSHSTRPPKRGLCTGQIGFPARRETLTYADDNKRHSESQAAFSPCPSFAVSLMKKSFTSCHAAGRIMRGTDSCSASSKYTRSYRAIPGAKAKARARCRRQDRIPRPRPHGSIFPNLCGSPR